eukprot:CAMPEP_0202959324 /NCGR_PEP_ID=MMETSP1396-20130829/3538_1 /ASSEMBLY_ACC=CAM_ASM_000872 /TAXON_ID= /ORGANISM="Pseudokeronopsis sp., Strain Brazil" /LENGTH=78 /DNA_ID=CAMNT_0049677831 /DNA_START=298 /DNA_END=534 /DNA_ORIENTATION=-
MHGFGDEGSTWLFQEREKNLIFSLLEQRKYDIWIGNSREASYAKGHKDFDHSDPRYWNFTFYEMATEDLPAFIDYILA